MSGPPNFDLLRALGNLLQTAPEAVHLHAAMTAAWLAGDPAAAAAFGLVLTEHTGPVEQLPSRAVGAQHHYVPTTGRNLFCAWNAYPGAPRCELPPGDPVHTGSTSPEERYTVSAETLRELGAAASLFGMTTMVDRPEGRRIYDTARALLNSSAQS